MKVHQLLFSGSVLVLIALLSVSCKHDPFTNGGDPVTPDGEDTTGTNTGGNSGRICNPDSVYFAVQVLPILRSNCAMSGCHDEASHEEGVVLTTYEKVVSTGKVRAGRPTSSKLYEVLTKTEDDRMPPAPRQALSADQIQLISKWISQGAQDLSCDPDAGGCKTTNISFAGDLFPVLKTYCKGCHSGSAAPAGVDLTTYAGTKAAVQTGRFFGSINHQSGFSPMPLNSPKLSACTISQFKAWFDAGMPNN